MTSPTSLLTRCWSVAKGFARPELMIAFAIIAAALAVPSIAMQGDTIADRVLGQIGRDERRSRPGEVRRSGDENPVDGANLAGDRGAFVQRSDTHRHVHGLANEIVSCVIQRELDAQHRMVVGETGQPRHDRPARERRGCSHP